MAEKKLVPIPLSELPILQDDLGDFWLFCSKENPNNTFDSARFNLTEYLGIIQSNLQLERRLAITAETAQITMFIGESMTIYKVEADNVASLKINGINTAIDTDISIPIDSKSKVVFEIVRKLTDPAAYLFIYAKAILP